MMRKKLIIVHLQMRFHTLANLLVYIYQGEKWLASR